MAWTPVIETLLDSQPGPEGPLPRIAPWRFGVGLDYRRNAFGARVDVLHVAAQGRVAVGAPPVNFEGAGQFKFALVDGAGTTTFWSNDFTPVKDVRTRFHEPGMSHLGFGLPYALALKLLHPGRAVLNITGDGSFGFTLNELDTARRERLPVINVIHNNAAWGIIRQGQKMQFDFELGTSLDETDYAAVARGFGCHGEVVRRAQDVGPAMARAIASGLPAVLDCRTRFLPHPAMPMFGTMNRYGFDALTGPAPHASEK